jgi:hypothetical protein
MVGIVMHCIVFSPTRGKEDWVENALVASKGSHGLQEILVHNDGIPGSVVGSPAIL